MKDQTLKNKRMTTSAIMLAMATVLALVCALIPFLHLPFGGSFTIASMLPIVVLSYMYGIKWGLLTSCAYAGVQIVIDLCYGQGGVIMALFTPNSEDYMGMGAAISILIIDYLLAYGVLGLGGLFRRKLKNKTAALCLGCVVALSLRYLCHILSGYIFYGAWAEWFFSQDGFYAIGAHILNVFTGQWLSLIYSVFYNGLYMIPEIIVTAVAAVFVSRIPAIRPEV
ncbi:MAG: energy-coupled thiamine transporter ThiT [Clostridia bacterium]|nr:energy-coupled thiamine transporter ThiT [Clostridia bacterium]